MKYLEIKKAEISVQIEEAIYWAGNEKKLMSLEDLNKNVATSEMKNFLYCATPGCKARLQYINGIKRNYLKTWRLHNHSTNCLNFFQRNQNMNSNRGRRQVDYGLSRDHKYRVLREMYIESQMSDEERETRHILRRKQIKRKFNPTVNREFDAFNRYKVWPRTGQIEFAFNEILRQPPIKKRYTPGEISDRDNGNARCVIGKILHVMIEENRAVLKYEINKGTCNVYFEEAFFANAPLNIDIMLNFVKIYVEREKELKLICIGNIEKSLNDIRIFVNNFEDILLNGYNLQVFTREVSSS